MPGCGVWIWKSVDLMRWWAKRVLLPPGGRRTSLHWTPAEKLWRTVPATLSCNPIVPYTVPPLGDCTFFHGEIGVGNFFEADPCSSLRRLTGLCILESRGASKSNHLCLMVAKEFPDLSSSISAHSFVCTPVLSNVSEEYSTDVSRHLLKGHPWLWTLVAASFFATTLLNSSSFSDQCSNWIQISTFSRGDNVPSYADIVLCALIFILTPKSCHCNRIES